MEAIWIGPAGLAIEAPVTAGTNLFLAGQCLLYARSLRRESEASSRLWGGFFLSMAVATLAGVAKHGFEHQLSEAALGLVLWVINVAGGVSTYCAQRATLAVRAPRRVVRLLRWLPEVQLGLFLVGNLVLGPWLPLLLGNTAVGLFPVMMAEGRAFLRGSPGGGWIVGGLSLSLLTAGVYVGRVSMGAWLNHIDIAHVLMAVSFWLIVRGSRPDAVAPAVAAG